MNKRYVVQGVNDYDLELGEKQDFNIVDTETQDFYTDKTGYNPVFYDKEQAERFCDNLNNPQNVYVLCRNLFDEYNCLEDNCVDILGIFTTNTQAEEMKEILKSKDNKKEFNFWVDVYQLDDLDTSLL